MTAQNPDQGLIGVLFFKGTVNYRRALYLCDLSQSMLYKTWIFMHKHQCRRTVTAAWNRSPTELTERPDWPANPWLFSGH